MGTKTLLVYLLAAIVVFIFAVLPQIIPILWVTLIIELLILSLAGLSVNFLLGYGGMMPFGHSAFYASGAYVTAILLNRTELPPVLILIFAPLFAAFLGALFGIFLSKLYGFYFAIMTTAFCMLVWSMIRKLGDLTGGDIGIANISIPHFLESINAVYYYTIFIFLLSVVTLWIIINSPFGWTLRAIKENSSRMMFTGISVAKHRFMAIVISCFYCGSAGSLYAIYSRTVFPEYAYWTVSGDLVTLVVLGGMNSFFGPVIGAFIWTFLRTVITSYTIYWPMTIGLIIVAVVLFMPEGIVGLFRKVFEKSFRIQDYFSLKRRLSPKV
jgi:branched-chain amino acid transport system permease protein